jgi:hypothetical protein
VYFFLSGFEEIWDKLDQNGELRLLIGSTTTPETIEQLAKGYKRLDLVESAAKRAWMLTKNEQRVALNRTERDAQETLSLMDQTDRGEQLGHKLIAMIEQKRLVVRVYTKARLHAGRVAEGLAGHRRAGTIHRDHGRSRETIAPTFGIKGAAPTDRPRQFRSASVT